MNVSMITRVAAVLLFFCTVTVFGETDPNRFQSVTAGVALTKPESWTFLSIRSAMENRARIKLQDEEFGKAVRELAAAPLVVIAKHPEPYDSLNPTFQLLVRPVPEEVANTAPEKMLELMLPALRSSFAEFVLEQSVERMTVDGEPAAHFVGRYTVSTTDGQSFRTRGRIVVVPRQGFVMMIGMSAPPEGADDARAEFEAILKSVELDD